MSGGTPGHGDEGPTDEVASSAVEFLRAVGAGDDRAVDLAARLAESLLEETGARLALSVLEGGPLAITRAIRLAEHVLRFVSATGVQPAASGGAS
jgi:hypothetical protein